MSRINTNVSSLIAQRVLGSQNNALTKSLERLSTGYRINRGADGPAALIASEKLRSEKASLTAALSNAERADQIVNVAEGGLQEISALLTELQSLVSESANDAGLSTEEKEANQLQVDAIIQTIDRIAATTSFEGSKLLNGGFDFQVSGVNAAVADYSINGLKRAEGTNVDVNLIVTTSAQHAGLFLSAGAAGLDLDAATSSFTFEIAGSKGSREFSFSSGTTLANMASSINNFKSTTGVSASVSGTGLVLKSEEFGSAEFVSVNVSNDGGQAGGVYTLSSTDENTATVASVTAFSAVSSPVRDEGQDVGAIINGIVARGKGSTAIVNSDAIDMQIDLTDTGAQTLAAVTALSVYGGGAKFNLGPTVDVGNQVTLGIKNVAARNLGNSTVGFLDDLGSGKSNNLVDGDLEAAQTIVNKVIDQVTSLRGRLGAFQNNVVGSTINALGVALENTSAAESVIRDTDFAAETAELTRSQILVAAATNALSIANSTPSNVLSLLQ